jgi:hypothetical protein
MKHRWLVSLLLSTVLALAACTPAEGGERLEESAPGPADFYDGY